MNVNIIKAAVFAKLKHEGQIRKFTGEKYVQHPIRVAANAKRYGLSDNAIMAGYLHDTVEDTDTKLSEIRSMFGDEVADLVAELTLDKTSYYDQESKTKYITNEINKMSDEAFTVKLLDRLDNVYNLSEAPIKFGKKYSLETSQIMDNIRPRSSLDVKLIKEIIAAIQPVYDMYW